MDVALIFFLQHKSRKKSVQKSRKINLYIGGSERMRKIHEVHCRLNMNFLCINQIFSHSCRIIAFLHQNCFIKKKYIYKTEREKIQEYCIIIAYSHEHSNAHSRLEAERPFLSTRRFISMIPRTKIIGRRDEYRREILFSWSSKCKLKIFHHKFLQFSLNMNKCMKRSPSTNFTE